MSAREILKQLKVHATEETCRRKLVDTEGLLGAAPAREIAARLGNGVEAFNSVLAAICCSLRHLDSFEKTVVEAVRLGEDADTIACMADAVSGARQGIEAIPQEWAAKLESEDYIEKLALDLWETAH